MRDRAAHPRDLIENPSARGGQVLDAAAGHVREEGLALASRLEQGAKVERPILDPMEAKELYMQANRRDIDIIERCEEEEREHVCTFYFVNRDFILNCSLFFPNVAGIPLQYKSKRFHN